MEPTRFDEFTRALSQATTRRQSFKILAGTLAGGFLWLGTIGQAFAGCYCNQPGYYPECCPPGSQGTGCCPDGYPVCCPQGSMSGCCPSDHPVCCPQGSRGDCAQHIQDCSGQSAMGSTTEKEQQMGTSAIPGGKSISPVIARSLTSKNMFGNLLRHWFGL